MEEQSYAMPAYDSPERSGYVAPGVTLIMKDMAEVEKDHRDVFALTSATINVTCKPKYSYSSSATNWANDMYANRGRRYWSSLRAKRHQDCPCVLKGLTRAV